MRSKIVLVTAAVYITFLGATNQLGLYIHPRYTLFTVIMAVIAFILTSVDKSNIHDDSSHRTFDLAMLPLIFLLVTALFLPARTLSSATVSQRTTDAGSIITTADSKSSALLFAGSSKGLGIADWSRLLLTNTDANFYLNKPANVSGFVYDAAFGDDTIWIARFVLTCCAVDAQPTGIPVRIPNWSSEYKQDEWIRVEGTFSLQPTARGEQIVLVPDKINKIDTPKDPYAR